MSDLLPPIDPAVIRAENMLNRRWPRKLTARIEGLRRLITEVLGKADPATGVVRLDLGALKVPAALRIDLMRDLVTYNYFLPFAPAKTRAKSREKTATYGRPGVLAPLLCWLYWEKGAPLSRVFACVSLPIQRLLSDIQADLESGGALGAIHVPGKHASKLFKFLRAQESWPVTASIPELRQAVLGSTRGKSAMHQRGADFMRFGIEASVKIINKYSDLRVQVTKEYGTEAGHWVVKSMTFSKE